VTESRKHFEHHQALFAEVNDRIRDGANLDVAIFVCECGYEDCMSTVALSLEEYKRIRSNPTWFVLKPDHVIPEIARVISEDTGFVVVERLTVFDYEREMIEQGAEQEAPLA
jgi:hypothetical protein